MNDLVTVVITNFEDKKYIVYKDTKRKIYHNIAKMLKKDIYTVKVFSGEFRNQNARSYVNTLKNRGFYPLCCG